LNDERTLTCLPYDSAMPQGRYRVIGDDGVAVGTEEFRCAPGPAGWRYVSEVDTHEYGPHRATVDIAVDAAWRIARVRVETGEHRLLLQPRNEALVGERDDEPIEVAWGPEDHLDYFTPATNLITCRRLGESAEVDVVFVDPFSLEPTRERQRYELLGPDEAETAVGRFAAHRWRYTSLGSGWTSLLWVAGDMVVRFDRIFELVWYEPGASGPRPLA
jgi:hypothetical protein